MNLDDALCIEIKDNGLRVYLKPHGEKWIDVEPGSISTKSEYPLFVGESRPLAIPEFMAMRSHVLRVAAMTGIPVFPEGGQQC